jgi:hypothetical protein
MINAGMIRSARRAASAAFHIAKSNHGHRAQCEFPTHP